MKSMLAIQNIFLCNIPCANTNIIQVLYIPK